MNLIGRISSFFVQLPRNLKVLFVDWIWQILNFTLLLIVYLTKELLTFFVNFRFSPPPLKWIARTFLVVVNRGLSYLTRYEENTINRISLIDLAIKNMKFKKSRAFITVGGMAVGIGTIVFLVSLGYGVNKLVIDRVARLEEMMQTDVLSQPGSQINITDETISRFNDLPSVDKALPMIAVVAKVNFQNSVSDMAVYGVTTDYLKQSAVKPIHGSLFESDELSSKGIGGTVAGISTTIEIENEEAELEELDPSEHHVEYSINGGEWLRVRATPELSGKVIGYTRRVEGVQTGLQVIGDKYIADGQPKSTWIQTSTKIWEKKSCSEVPCEEGQYIPLFNESDEQVVEEGYVATIGMSVSTVKKTRSSVLGLSTLTEEPLEISNMNMESILGLTDEASESASTTSASTSTTTKDGIIQDGDWVVIASESGTMNEKVVKTIALGANAKKQAVVNTSMLQILGINESEAVGKTFEASFIVVGNLLGEDDKIESESTSYTITGVIPDDSAPFFYVPFIDLRSLGIKNYSQIKVVVDNQNELASVRRQVEALGFATSSVADTVEQIDALFATIRSVLALLGMVALAIASLGMFNTLTVSLLERTREVGLMKAMGMKSHEVRELFLTESMIMGFFGGLSGIIIGFLAGKLLSLALSSLSLIQGQGFINITYIPTAFIAVIFTLSLIVGVFTGIYPARRATKISALNALRYE